MERIHRRPVVWSLVFAIFTIGEMWKDTVTLAENEDQQRSEQQ